jgi:hypothetical protein
MTFNQSHYDLLLPLKKRWEIFKSSKTITQLININEQNAMNKVMRDVKGREIQFECSECIIEALTITMNLFDEYEKEKGNIA